MTGTVGLVGLGTMGSCFAARLLDAGVDLVVYDSSPEAIAVCVARGATAAPSPRAIADAASTVLVSLPSPRAAQEVACSADGLISGAAIATYVDLSTTGPTVAEQIAEQLAGHGVRSVDAPVSGGPAGAEAGTLTIMTSGEQHAIQEVRPLLEVLGSRLFIVGPRPGQAQLVKLINNLLSAAAIAITAEALALGQRGGLDPAVVLDVVHVSSGANKAASDKFPNQVLTRAFNHGFRLDLMAKDVRLCLAEATRHQVPMMLGGAVDQLWRLAENQLEDGADCTAIAKVIEQWASTEIKPLSSSNATREGQGRVAPG